MKQFKLHKGLEELRQEAYDAEGGTVHFSLFDGRSVCITDYGNEFRIQDFKNYTETFVTGDELRRIMFDDEEQHNFCA